MTALGWVGMVASAREVGAVGCDGGALGRSVGVATGPVVAAGAFGRSVGSC